MGALRKSSRSLSHLLMSSCLLEYSFEYLNEYSSTVLINTGSTLIQAANNEEGGGGLVGHTGSASVVTGSIARSAKRQYLSNSEADFDVFRPAGSTTRCTDGGEIVN